MANCVCPRDVSLSWLHQSAPPPDPSPPTQLMAGRARDTHFPSLALGHIARALSGGALGPRQGHTPSIPRPRPLLRQGPFREGLVPPAQPVPVMANCVCPRDVSVCVPAMCQNERAVLGTGRAGDTHLLSLAPGHFARALSGGGLGATRTTGTGKRRTMIGAWPKSSS
jgi:hypothetical protein